MNLRCETCRWWDRIDNECGLCRVNPPALIQDDVDGHWPIVEPDDWCGEHEERIELPTVEG